MRAWVALPGLACAPAWAADHTITFTCCVYSNPNLTIQAGDRVIWNGAFGADPLRQVVGPASDTPTPGGFANSVGFTFNLIFDERGEIYYQCTAHGLAQTGGQMRGRITVLDLYTNGFE